MGAITFGHLIQFFIQFQYRGLVTGKDWAIVASGELSFEIIAWPVE